MDEEFDRALVQPMVSTVSKLLAEPLGRVADIEIDQGKWSGDVAAVESLVANFVNDAMAARCRRAGYAIDFAILDSSSINHDLAPNTIVTFEDCFRLMPHADVIRLFEISGKQLAALLDDNARRALHAGSPGTDPCFVQFSREVRYAIEVDKSRNDARARDIRLNNVPLQVQDRTFRFACSSFARQRDKDWLAHAANNQWNVVSVCDLPSIDTPLRLRDELVEYIREHGGISADGGARRDGRVRFI